MSSSSADRYNDDPTATYRGYRRQALYCLFRLFDDALPENCVVHPEANEDLAIYNPDGELIEIVQVKDLSSPLTVSSFNHSFYKRISEYCGPNSKVIVKIATFGDVGPELAKALDNEQEIPNRSIETLIKERNGKPGLSLEEAKNIFYHLEREQVDEANLTSRILDQLKGTITSGDPVRAFENLMWWLISSAEKQKKLTRFDTINQLNLIGRFIDHRAAHEYEWNISIKPIEYPSPEELEEEKLRSEFFQGGRVRPKHIAAKLDVPRLEALHEIHKLFQQENVVILRAASGQGKTTLAYRYLLEWAPDDFRYEILQADDFQHARRMSVAIKGHTEAIDVPTVVYLDVRPGDNLWVEFVRELADVSSLRILVTIREEDWFRSRVTTDQFSFTEYSVVFDEDTGREMFRALKSSGFGEKVLDFTEAWSKLGERKTLFEFVYLTTQNEQLSDRIKAQISSLKDQVNSGSLGEGELKLLRLVAIASAYEARLKLKELVRYAEIPEPTQTLERFSNEYLLRTSSNGRYVEGFHAIRSEILAAELSDEVLQPRGEIEEEVLPLLVEDDLGSFLLYSFSRNPLAANKIAQSLDCISFQTWSGVRGAFTALQWLGLKRYVDSNAKLIDDVREIYCSGWWIVLDWDLAQVRGKSGFGFLDNLRHMSKEMEFAAVSAENIQEQQTNKDDVFVYVSNWMKEFIVPASELDNIKELMALAEVLFWLGHLKLIKESIQEWFSEEFITTAWDILPIHLFADFAYAIRTFNSEVYMDWLQKNNDEVRIRLRTLLSIIAFIEEDDCLVTHFIIDGIDRKNSEIRSYEDVASINELAIERVEVISRCLPGFKQYSTFGYGHQMALLGDMYDESTRAIPVENITMPWLPEFNALAQGVVDLRYRSKSWSRYFEEVRNMRKRVLTAFRDLRKLVADIASRREAALRDLEEWDECKRIVNSQLYLPSIAVDEWGYVTESRSSKFLNEPIRRKFSTISTLEPLTKAIDKYMRTVSDFMQQAIQALVLVPNLRTAMNQTTRKSILEEAKKHNITEDSIRLSVDYGIDACIAVREVHGREKLMSESINEIVIDELNRNEDYREFLETMRVWCIFCYPEQILPKQKQANKKAGRKKKKKIELRDSLNSTENRIKDALTRLKSKGIEAQILTDQVRWDQDSALWIVFNTQHPLGTFAALEYIWHSFVDSFKPDIHKIVKIKAVEVYWKKIVLIPLVKGRSLEKQAFPNISGVTFMVDDDPEPKFWEFTPEQIPATAWDELKLLCWEKRQEWEVFDKFNMAYSTLYFHVNHIADFSRCNVDQDDLGEKILQDYIRIEEKRAEPYLQETFDACTQLLNDFPEIGESEILDHINNMECLQLVVSMKEAIYPCEDYDQQAKLTIDEIANWRDRLQAGFEVLAQARFLWMAESLGLDSYDYPESTDCHT
ncbi:hypothetical protein [Gimesia chilikensis]|uniref:hypothetical protein n=1 Tax=Gimesia chilikensis TaxID=2605989 RepID=UPI001187EB95|nr:hypothetical protein [Gimesia chilikensis]QDT84681.1 hypothetical protein MalM14_23430 [Gimesia chilikensis]